MADTAVTITPTTQLSTNDTIATIKSLLDLLGIPYPSTAVKSDLFALLPAANVLPDTGTTSSTDTSDNTVTDNATTDTTDTSTVQDSTPTNPTETAPVSDETTVPVNNTPDTQTTPQEQPEPTQTPSVPTYTVEVGDTIAGVATKFGMSVGKLQKLNVPLNVVLVPGRVLKLA